MMMLDEKLYTRTSNGVLSKGLYSDNGIEYIVKGSSRKCREPLSEYFSSKVFSLFMDTVNYSVLPADRFPELKSSDYTFVSVCRKLPYNIVQFGSLLKGLDRQGMSPMKFRLKKIEDYKLDKIRIYSLFLVDALIGNQDRH